MKKTNVISFSLWGSEEKYITGALENLKLASEIYPGWSVRIYVDTTVTLDYCKELHKNGADIRLVKNNNKGLFYGAFWRFFVNDDESVDRYLVRDIDSRLNFREYAAVQEWISADKDYHIMRDHPNHKWPIQAGMWGGKANKFKIMPLINKVSNLNYYGCDERFLMDEVFPKIKDSCTVHDSNNKELMFPVHPPIYNGGTFVGQDFINNILQGSV